MSAANGQSPAPPPVGASQVFVLAQGFRALPDGTLALIAHDGGLRLFADLTADPDRPEVRTGEAWRTLLASMQPGWSLRALQLFWPDPEPRTAFLAQGAAWASGEQAGRQLLRESLLLFLERHPLPFMRRTVLEFAFPGDEGLAWWESLPRQLGVFGVVVRPLAAEGVQALAHHLFNPVL